MKRIAIIAVLLAAVLGVIATDDIFIRVPRRVSTPPPPVNPIWRPVHPDATAQAFIAGDYEYQGEQNGQPYYKCSSNNELYLYFWPASTRTWIFEATIEAAGVRCERMDYGTGNTNMWAAETWVYSGNDGTGTITWTQIAP